MTTLILNLFLLGLVFAAIDQPLVFAFYARRDTLTPAIVGVVGMLIYLAASLAPLAWRPLAITDLAVALTLQLISHALIMLVLVERRLRQAAGHGLRGQGLAVTTLRAGAAALVMAPVAYGAQTVLSGPLGPSTLGRALALAPAGLLALAVYIAVLALLRTPELSQGWGWLRARVRRG
jgi:putative peptidoglycan lipid II flippase